MPLPTEALTFDVLDDLLLAHERGRVPPVRLVPGPCLGSIIELFHFSQENNGALPYRASDDTAAIQRAYETRRPVYLNGESTAFVTARRAQYKGGDTHWTAFQVAMHKALLAAGFPSLLARGLVGAISGRGFGGGSPHGTALIGCSAVGGVFAPEGLAIEIPIEIAVSDPAMNSVPTDPQLPRQGAPAGALLQVVPQ